MFDGCFNCNTIKCVKHKINYFNVQKLNVTQKNDKKKLTLKDKMSQ